MLLNKLNTSAWNIAEGYMFVEVLPMRTGLFSSLSVDLQNLLILLQPPIERREKVLTNGPGHTCASRKISGSSNMFENFGPTLIVDGICVQTFQNFLL